MSNVFKLLLTNILCCALLTSPMLKAQETPADLKTTPFEQPAEAPLFGRGASPLSGGGLGGRSSNTDSPTSNLPVPIVTAEEEELRIFCLKNSDARQTTEVIEQLFGGRNVRVAVDERTNSLIVRSSEPLLQQIEAILLRLDEQPGKTTSNVRSIPSPLSDPMIATPFDPSVTAEQPSVSIAEYRRRLSDLELPLLQLGEKVRSTEASLGKDHAETVKQRSSLRESIQKAFAARQEIQRAEVAEFTHRLHRMQQSIDARDRIADKIVDRRLDELLDPEANWDSALSATSETSNTEVVRSDSKPAAAGTWLPAAIKANSIEAEITFTIPGDDRKVFYWHGFPIDGTNTAVLARDNFRPGSNAEQVKADAEILRMSIESITVLVRTEHGIRSLPAKLERVNPDLALLLVSVDAKHVFESLPFDNIGPAVGQRVTAIGNGGEESLLILESTEAFPGVYGVQHQVYSGDWSGTVLLDSTSQRFLAMATTFSQNNQTRHGIIPAPHIAKWLGPPTSTIGMHLNSDRNLDLTAAGQQHSDALADKVVPEFETPQALLDYMYEHARKPEDIAVVTSCVTEEESRKLAGMGQTSASDVPKEESKPEWQIVVNGDHAVATDMRKEAPKPGNVLTSNTMELTRINGE